MSKLLQLFLISFFLIFSSNSFAATALIDADTVLVDARPHAMYTGEVIKHAVQGGHIPGAINIVSLDGFRMSLAYMQLESLGYKNIRLLNGGWSIWDQAMTLPIVKGEKPYDKEYAL